MAEMRTFYASGIDQGDVARKISSWLKINDFEAQIVDLPDGRITVQAHQPKSWRYILGMSSALNITLDKKGDQLVVETGAGSWAEKVAVGAVGIFILHPLLITMAYGVWKQSQLPEKVFEITEQYIKEKQGPAGATRVPVQSTGEPATEITTSEIATTENATTEAVVPEQISTTTSEEMICASCGQATSKDSKYCAQCGAKLGSVAVEID
jgi:hypothetical protein